MAKKNNRTVFRNEEGMWANKKDSNTKATSLHDTQQGAVAKAKRQIVKDGGGELTIKDLYGKIRSKDTIGPGNDPNPPKDKKR